MKFVVVETFLPVILSNLSLASPAILPPRRDVDLFGINPSGFSDLIFLLWQPHQAERTTTLIHPYDHVNFDALDP